MASLNQVHLIGNVGRDAELKYTPSGFAIANFSMAVTQKQKNQQGVYVEQTEWFNIVLLGKTAENLSQYIAKGNPIFVDGRFQTRTWDDDQGVKHYRTEVVANNIQLLGSKQDSSSGPRTSGKWNDNPMKNSSAYEDPFG